MGLRCILVNYNQFIPMDEHEVVDLLVDHRQDHDLMVVYAHWGNEYEPVARDATRSLARSFVDAGADVVIGSHPHVMQDVEEYRGKRIYYSLGNMVFDQYFSEEVREGMLVEVVLDEEGGLSFEEYGIWMEYSGQTVLRE